MVGDESSGPVPELEFVTTITRAMKLDRPVNFENEYELPEAVTLVGGFRTVIRKQMDLEAFHRDPFPFDDLRLTNEMIYDEDRERKKIQNLVKNGVKSLLKGNSKLAVSKLQAAFDEIAKFPSTVFDNPKDYIWTKYAYFMSLIEENSYSGLLNAHKLLQELEKSLFSDAPIYHYAMAKLLTKFNRFQLAENEIKLCRDSMKGHKFQAYNWPSTDVVIKETTSSGLEEYLNDLTALCGCETPDAICKYSGCMDSSSHPFPSKDIFISDGNFKGYVVLICEEGCKMQYHPSCWKKVKDSFSDLEKLSDKDCLGRPCVTPDCKNSDNKPSIINKIEIIGTDGNVKSQCAPDTSAENKQKEIALGKKRLRQKSDEHKTEKQPNKNKVKPKKATQLNQAQSVEDIPHSVKNPAPKENHTPQVSEVSVPVKTNMQVKKEENKEDKCKEPVVDDASQREFIYSYFQMLLAKKGSLNRKQFEEEWDKFFPGLEPFSKLRLGKDRVFNLLKKSKYFIFDDDCLRIRDSSGTSGSGECSNAVSICKEDPNKLQVENTPYKAEENAYIVSEIKEIEKKLANKSASLKLKELERKSCISATVSEVNDSCSSESCLSAMQSTSTQMVDAVLENSVVELSSEEDEPANNSTPLSKDIPRRSSCEGFDDIQSDINAFAREFNEIPVARIVENPGLSTVLESTAAQEKFRAVTPPVHWRDNALNARYSSRFYARSIPDMTEQIITPQSSFRRDGFCQTDPIPENNLRSGDNEELWVQHIQLAVTDLLKKNKELIKSKDQMEISYKREIECLVNQLQALRNGHAAQVEALNARHAKYEEEKRRMMALEARIKIQEDILQVNREELRRKDFDLLDAKKYLGIAILERLERESNKQVKRLVEALAELPCNDPDAEAIGQAMSRWETTGNKACRAKNAFLEECAKSQAMLYEGYGIESFEHITIPIIEEPAGQCPLDKLSFSLLSEKASGVLRSGAERAGISSNRTRPENVATSAQLSPSNSARSHSSSYPSSSRHSSSQPSPSHSSSTYHSASIPSPFLSNHHLSSSLSSSPIPPISYGARPKEIYSVSDGEIYGAARNSSAAFNYSNASRSSTPGRKKNISSKRKLLIELQNTYPSRTMDELRLAISSVRQSNKSTFTGLSIRKIVELVGNALDWWPEPSDGVMGVDKFVAWADISNAEELRRAALKKRFTRSESNIVESVKCEAEKEDCCICLQPMNSSKTELGCSHTFHTKCIRKWLAKESICPICRTFTRMADEFPTLS